MRRFAINLPALLSDFRLPINVSFCMYFLTHRVEGFALPCLVFFKLFEFFERAFSGFLHRPLSVLEHILYVLEHTVHVSGQALRDTTESLHTVLEHRGCTLRVQLLVFINYQSINWLSFFVVWHATPMLPRGTLNNSVYTCGMPHTFALLGGRVRRGLAPLFSLSILSQRNRLFAYPNFKQYPYGSI